MHLELEARRVLIYRIGSLGDTIAALPCFHLIERCFPNAQRILLTNYPVHVKAPAAASILGGSGLIHDYFPYTVNTRSPRELLRLALWIRRLKPDVMIYLMPARPLSAAHRDKRFFVWAAGIRRIIGLPADEQVARDRDQVTGLFESEASRLARSLAALGDAAITDPAGWDLRLTPSEKETARTALGRLAGRPIIACGPGTKMQAKDWGQDRWRSLLAKLSHDYPDHGLALIGAAEDAAGSDFASLDWRGPKLNLCGRLSPRETAAALEHASVFLGPDSGPMHLAACVGVRCVIPFSARGLPGVWYPAGPGHRIFYSHVSCAGCNLETCVTEQRRCLTSITVDEIAAAVQSVLSEKTTDQIPQ